MSKPAKQILEREYGIVLSEKKPYYQHSSVEMLNTSGRLADLRIMGRILFALCDVVDKQQQQIDELIAINNANKSDPTARSNTTPAI